MFLSKHIYGCNTKEDKIYNYDFWAHLSFIDANKYRYMFINRNENNYYEISDDESVFDEQIYYMARKLNYDIIGIINHISDKSIIMDMRKTSIS